MGGYLIIPWHALFLSTPLSSALCERMSNFTYLYMLTKPLATLQAAWSRSFTSKLFAWRILSSSFAVRVEYRDIPMCEHYVPVYKAWYTNHTNQNNSQSAGDLYHLRYPNLRISDSSLHGLSPASSSASHPPKARIFNEFHFNDLLPRMGTSTNAISKAWCGIRFVQNCI